MVCSHRLGACSTTCSVMPPGSPPKSLAPKSMPHGQLLGEPREGIKSLSSPGHSCISSLRAPGQGRGARKLRTCPKGPGAAGHPSLRDTTASQRHPAASSPLCPVPVPWSRCWEPAYGCETALGAGPERQRCRCREDRPGLMLAWPQHGKRWW